MYILKSLLFSAKPTAARTGHLVCSKRVRDQQKTSQQINKILSLDGLGWAGLGWAGLGGLG